MEHCFGKIKKGWMGKCFSDDYLHWRITLCVFSVLLLLVHLCVSQTYSKKEIGPMRSYQPPLLAKTARSGRIRNSRNCSRPTKKSIHPITPRLICWAYDLVFTGSYSELSMSQLLTLRPACKLLRFPLIFKHFHFFCYHFVFLLNRFPQ